MVGPGLASAPDWLSPLEGYLDGFQVGTCTAMTRAATLVTLAQEARQCADVLSVKPHLPQVLKGSISCISHWSGQHQWMGKLRSLACSYYHGCIQPWLSAGFFVICNSQSQATSAGFFWCRISWQSI